MPDAEAGTLVLHRFDGDEVFMLKRAEVSGSRAEDGYVLCLEAWSFETPVKTLGSGFSTCGAIVMDASCVAWSRQQTIEESEDARR